MCQISRFVDQLRCFIESLNKFLENVSREGSESRYTPSPYLPCVYPCLVAKNICCLFFRLRWSIFLHVIVVIVASNLKSWKNLLFQTGLKTAMPQAIYFLISSLAPNRISLIPKMLMLMLLCCKGRRIIDFKIKMMNDVVWHSG